MNPNTIRLQRDTALLITGPQGCGKTRMARAIAERHGTYVEAPGAHVLTNASELRAVMLGIPRTLIIDEMPRRAAALEAVKAWITEPGPLLVRKPYGTEAMRLRKPHLIFCSSERDPLRGLGGRRFRVIELDSDGRVVRAEGPT